MDGYDVLGLRVGASERQVRMAYRRLARLHHPDRKALGGRDAAMRRMQLINVAREQVLQDVRERSRNRPASVVPQRDLLREEQRTAAAACLSDAALRRQRLAREQALRRQREERLRWAAAQVELARDERHHAPDPASVVVTMWAWRVIAGVITAVVLVLSLVFGASIGLWLGDVADSVIRVVSDDHTWSVAAQPLAVAAVVLMSLVASVRAGWAVSRNLWR